jgi:hypothetical protein
MKPWWHYLEGADHKIMIQCHHKILEYFHTSKVLSRRSARWAEVLSSYNFAIQHLEDTKNPKDESSRRPGYVIAYENPVRRLLANLVATVERYEDLLPAFKTAQATDSLAVEVNSILVDIPMIGGPEGCGD